MCCDVSHKWRIVQITAKDGSTSHAVERRTPSGWMHYGYTDTLEKAKKRMAEIQAWVEACAQETRTVVHSE